MLLPLKVIISNKPRKDGNSVLYFQYCFSSTNRVLLNTELSIPATYWNKKRQMVSKLLPFKYGDFKEINSELSRMQKILEAIIEHGKRIEVSDIGTYVKDIFHPKFNPAILTRDLAIIPQKRKELDFFKEIDAYILSKEKKVCSTACFRSMKERLLAFQMYRKKNITFSSLDYNFYLEFIEFLTYEYQLKRNKAVVHGLKVSTIGSTIKNLRVFINDRVRRKIIAPINMDDFKIIDEESDAIYLTYEEIGKIYTTDLSQHPYLIEFRDLFVLGCLTGLRFSDYSTLRYEDMRNGMLYKKTNKMDNWVIIPLREEAREIFDTHFKDRTPKVSNVLFNRYIKIIAEMAGINQLITFSYKKGNKDISVSKPKSQWITTHTCRRSFCSNEYLAGTEISLIMKISGHKTHKDFFKYIRITEEEAANKIKAIWTARDNMTVFSLTKTA
jgi:integrase